MCVCAVSRCEGGQDDGATGCGAGMSSAMVNGMRLDRAGRASRAVRRVRCKAGGGWGQGVVEGWLNRQGDGQRWQAS